MAKDLILLILAHGIFGWGTGGAGKRPDQMREYYFGVRAFLEAEYSSRPDVILKVLTPTVPPADSVAGRGAVLKKAIEEAVNGAPSGTRAHIVAHSMGGLDSRWVLAQEGMTEKIASLTTIATPHRGTTLGNEAHLLFPLILQAVSLLDKVASWHTDIVKELAGPHVDKLEFFHHLLANIVDSPKDKAEAGLYALTLKGADEFNRQWADAERKIRSWRDKPVAYFAYGGRVHPGQVPLLKLSHELLQLAGTAEEKESGNDGAVSVWSAHYPWDDPGPTYEGGENYVKTIQFDHFRQVNWEIPDPRPKAVMGGDLQDVYRGIMENIIRVQRAENPGR